MRTASAFLASCLFIGSTLAADIISTDGFTNCDKNGSSSVTVKNIDISFDKSTNDIVFNLAAHSDKEQKVKAKLVVTAYGMNVYNNEFDPCADSTFVQQLCPGMYIIEPTRTRANFCSSGR